MKAILFDLDGTLLDTERHNLVAFREAGLTMGFELTEEFYKTLVGLNRGDSNRLMTERFGPDCDIEDWRARRRVIFYERWDAGQGPGHKLGVEFLLDFLDARQVPYAIASSSFKIEVEDKLRRAGLLGRFPIRVAGDEVPCGKPHPDVFLEAARRLGVAAEDCLCVEDSPLGVEAARRAGMRVVFIPDMLEADLQVTEVCLAVLPSLVEVCELLAGSCPL